ncbi:GNAT family N-acetyltransferase [Neogemmobacter tilapiae]|uniref:N-acetyltransferase n=1 Tax=Neogemmobacter tilapiae TaxID=875041 RepID=A0A918WJN3_9RHOB|nr:GNAT family N-acetyltransferase [Gemmobacter tilapiae]GHC52020.1 N-acetyltransferase [Gemmobacter tilapiae]
MSYIVTRRYQPSDLAACLAVFDSNLPMYFAPEERTEFYEFLVETDFRFNPFLVLSQNNRCIACGGLNIDGGTASLCWGMVVADLHGQGFGSHLTEVRLELARVTPGLQSVHMITSQHTGAFYQRFGFELSEVTPNGIGVGLDRWAMTLHLNPAS